MTSLLFPSLFSDVFIFFLIYCLTFSSLVSHRWFLFSVLLSQLLSHSLPCYHSRLRSCSSLAKYLCDRLHRESQVYNNNIFQLQTQCFLFLLLLSQTNVAGLVQIFSFWNYFSFLISFQVLAKFEGTVMHFLQMSDSL